MMNLCFMAENRIKEIFLSFYRKYFIFEDDFVEVLDPVNQLTRETETGTRAKRTSNRHQTFRKVMRGFVFRNIKTFENKIHLHKQTWDD